MKNDEKSLKEIFDDIKDLMEDFLKSADETINKIKERNENT